MTTVTIELIAARSDHSTSLFFIYPDYSPPASL